MGWPAGFKLNLELNQFLGNLFLFYIENWSIIASSIAQWGPWIVRTVSLTGAIFGFSTMITLFSDFLSFMNMHVYWLYTAIAKACSLQLAALSSLWLLFRGKKKNVMKRCIDSCHYSTEQLLVGTLLFCTLFFLLPTSGSYFLFFVILRVAFLAIYASVRVMVALIHHFPLYELILYHSNSMALMSGLYQKMKYKFPKRFRVKEIFLSAVL